MQITQQNPTFIELNDLSDNEVEALNKLLTYTDKTAQYAAERFKKAYWFESKFGREAFVEELARLKSLVKVSLLKSRANGSFYTYSGLLPLIKSSGLVSPADTGPLFKAYPKASLLALEQSLPQLRPYQQVMVERLLKANHGAASACTGSGKSICLVKVINELGLKTLIIAPSVSIASQLYQDCLKYFGKKRVGMFGDGKKEFKKLITIGIAQSLTKLEPGDEAYKEFSKIQVLIGDESHLVSTDTQVKIAEGFAINCPYRFFFSATQFRNDGSDMLLQGITGEICFEYDLRQAVKEGYLAKPTFIVKRTTSDSPRYCKTALEVLKHHLYENKKLHQEAATLANQLLAKDLRVMIMIDHVNQFTRLLPHLTTKPEFAHGGLNKENKKGVPELYHKSDVVDLVNRFNAKEFPLLIGTSCIGMGTDTRPVDAIINLQGGQSDIKFMQLIGRGTRRVPGKTGFMFFDFDITNQDSMHRWFMTRLTLFKTLSDEIKFI